MLVHIKGCIMRTNIVLDEQLVREALKLSGKKTKKEVVNFALKKLVKLLKKKSEQNNRFIASYIDKPIVLTHFTPLNRDELHER